MYTIIICWGRSLRQLGSQEDKVAVYTIKYWIQLSRLDSSLVNSHLLYCCPWPESVVTLLSYRGGCCLGVAYSISLISTKFFPKLISMAQPETACGSVGPSSPLLQSFLYHKWVIIRGAYTSLRRRFLSLRFVLLFSCLYL